MTEPYFMIPKKKWPLGPWHMEPDRLEFRFKGLPCIMSRGSSGAWCGYVGVPPGHPWHGKSYNEVKANVHGGLTYANPCQGHICHVPNPGESGDVWWLGFDCAHAGDLGPAMLASIQFWNSHDRYWLLKDARLETMALAAQALEAAQ